MSDIERAMAQLKGTVVDTSGSDQASSESDGGPSRSHSATEGMPEVDLDIGVVEADYGPVALKPGGTYSLPIESGSGDFYNAAAGKQSQQHLGNSFESSRTHNLPLDKLAKAGLIIPDTPKSQITEEYRRIKRPLLKRLARSNENGETARNVIAVTSAMSGEGKTFSAINLAMSLAQEKNRTVLLIDADVVRHTAGELFGVSSNEPGLLDLLERDDIEPSDVVLNTNVARLSFLPAGIKNAHASELLSSENMSELIVDLVKRDERCIIVLDCPPIMQTNEAAILVDHAGQIVFVVAEEQTSQGMVTQALRLIGNESKVGVLLNKSTTRLGHYDFYNYAYS